MTKSSPKQINFQGFDQGLHYELLCKTVQLYGPVYQSGLVRLYAHVGRCVFGLVCSRLRRELHD